MITAKSKAAIKTMIFARWYFQAFQFDTSTFVRAPKQNWPCNGLCYWISGQKSHSESLRGEISQTMSWNWLEMYATSRAGSAMIPTLLP